MITTLKRHTDRKRFNHLEMIVDLNAYTEFDALEAYVYNCLPKFGLQLLAYHHLPLLGSIDAPCFNVMNFGFPKAFNKRFNEKNLQRFDPTLPIVMAQAKAIWWGDVELTSKITPEELAYLQSCVDANFGFGLTIPVFGPLGRNGYFSVGFGQEKPNLKTEEIVKIQMFFQTAHLHYCTLLLSNQSQQKKLSKREREILTWIARGKSNAVIADILGLKETSVVTYLQRTLDKLGTNNRVTATLRALAIGELNISEG